MKIREFFEKIDKSNDNKEKYIDLERICQELNIDYYYSEKEPELITSYFLSVWYCTDTWVGTRLYFFNDKPMALTYQGGRKMGEHFYWVSKEIYNEVKEYVQSLMVEEHNDPMITILNMDDDNMVGKSFEDGYKIEFNNQLIPNIHYKNAIYNGDSVEIVDEKRPPNNTYNLEKKVEIKFQDGSTKWVSLSKLIFKYNIKD